MNPPPYHREHLPPLTSQAAIEDRVQLLIGRAARRQIWLLFLDHEDRQLPLLIPVQDPPTQPAEDDDRKFAGLLAYVQEQTEARGFVAVIELPPERADPRVVTVDNVEAVLFDLAPAG